MKFGKKFHLYQVPAWEAHYLSYKQLKAMLKLAITQAIHSKTATDLGEFHACLNCNIATLDAFFIRHYAFLRHKQKCIYENYSPDSPGSRLPHLDLMDRSELGDVRAIFVELQVDYLELQWFSRVNEEATRRVFDKLRMVDQAFSHTRYEEMTRRVEEQRYRENQCSKQIERLQKLINDISQAYHSPQSDMYPKDLSLHLEAFHAQVPDALPYLTAIDGYIRTDQASDFANLLEEMHSILNIFRTKFQTLFYSLLAFSISARAWTCARILVTGKRALKNALVNHNCLNHLIGVTGRSNKRYRRGIYKDNYPESADPSLEEAGTRLFLETLEHLGLRSKEILQTKDAVGRLPLHYGAMYGLATICKSILEYLHDRNPSTFADRGAILTAADDGFTPLHWSVTRGHIEVTRSFLIALDPVLRVTDKPMDQHLRATLGGLLLIALKNQDDDMVHLLASSHINISHQSSSGETGMYVAALAGREDYVLTLLKIASLQNASIDVPERAYGWTPLFIACVEGHSPIVELLLQAGANETLVDYLGWTPKEHAAFRGHLTIAESLRMSKATGAIARPARKASSPKTSAKYQLRTGCTYIVVNLGVMQSGKQTTPVDFEYLPELHRGQPDTSLSLEVSISGGSNTSHLLRLPLLDDPNDDAFVFPIETLSEARLTFKLFRANPTHGHKGTLVGSGTVFLQDERNCFGAQRESLIRELCVPVLENETMGFLGTVTFTFVVVKPFPHLNTPTLSIGFVEKLDSVQLIGHRGLGQNHNGHKNLQLGENTVESFLSAAKLGASHVEFDVQVTRDLVPVLYHDFSLSESGTDVPIHDLTLQQFMYASKVQSPRGDPISVLGFAKPQTARSGMQKHKPRSRSLTGSQEKGTKEVQDRMKYTVDFASKGFKPNTRGEFIQGSFSTLEEALREVPVSIGFDMEIKYPRIHEALGADLAPVTIDLNIFVDTILTTIWRFAGGRNIILSSFTPEVCILLSLKQKAYPVLFITNAGKRPVADKEQRAGSLQAAVRFATQWGLAGVVLASDAFVMCPRLVGYVKGKGLVCGSYGTSNDVPETVEAKSLKLIIELGEEAAQHRERVKGLMQNLERRRKQALLHMKSQHMGHTDAPKYPPLFARYLKDELRAIRAGDGHGEVRIWNHAVKEVEDPGDVGAGEKAL